MKHLRPVFSAAQALRYAFLSPFQPQTCRPINKCLSPHGSRRSYAFYRPALDFTRTARIDPSLQIPTTPSPKAPQNEAIQYKSVQLAHDDGTVSVMIPIRQVLRSFDRTEFALVELLPPSKSHGPICKIMNRRALRELEYARSRPAKPKTAKRVELNWTIDPNDLEVRMNQVRSFIEKGKKVELVLAPKLRKRKATLEEAQKTLDLVKKNIEDMGAVQSKPMTGTMLAQVQFKLEGKKKAG